MARNYSFHNPVVEPRTSLTVIELIEHCQMHGIPLDATIVFRGERDFHANGVLETHRTYNGTHIILGGN